MEDIRNAIREVRKREVRCRVKVGWVVLDICTHRWVDEKLRDEYQETKGVTEKQVNEVGKEVDETMDERIDDKMEERADKKMEEIVEDEMKNVEKNVEKGLGEKTLRKCEAWTPRSTL